MGSNDRERLINLLSEDPNVFGRLGRATPVLKTARLEGWSASVTQFHGAGWALTGNASEFLDPIFSSGVTLALESSSRAAKLAHRQLNGETIDWDKDVFEPADRLAAIGEACGAAMTFFVEMGEYFWLCDNEPATARRMEDQWRDLALRGHDLQLHGAERKLSEGRVSYNGHSIDFGSNAPVFLTLKSGKILTTMNDSGHSTFPQIADWVETTILAELADFLIQGNPR